MSRRALSILALVSLVAIPALASDVPLTMDAGVYIAPPNAEMRAATTSDLVMASRRMLDEHRHHVGALTMIEQTKLHDTDSSGEEKGRLIIGVVRAMPQDIRLADIPENLEPGTGRTHRGGLLEKAADGSMTWSTAISSEGATALRFQLRANGFPAGTQAYVYTADGQVRGPWDISTFPPEGFLTTTVFAGEAYLEVHLGRAAKLGNAALTISEIAHIQHPSFSVKAGRPIEGTEDSCFVDASCVTSGEWSNAANATKAIGQYDFRTSTGQMASCTGGLLMNTKSDFTPYFLTANHCLTTQAEASTMVVYWRYQTSSCNGTAPNYWTLPTTTGATLLATNASSDFTFVRLSGNPPSGSYYLGWSGSTNYASTAGTKTYRMHHPYGGPMSYARHETTGITATQCGITTPGHFFSYDRAGGTAGGSSGSPVMLADMKVIGQLRGACGPDTDNNCDRRNYNVDGAFRTTYTSIQQYLAPGGGGTGPCVAGTNKMCLLSNRFEITLSARDPRTNATGVGQAVTISNTPGTGFGYFSIPALTGDPNNAEILVKMLDATSFSNYFWVFYGALTDFDVTITIRDTTTARVKTYNKPPLGLAGGSDTAAFPKN